MQHEKTITQSFSPQASAYLTSTAHATGRDLEVLSELIAGTPGAKVLDLGCGAGHATYAAARSAAEVVAYDLTDSMLRVVEKTAGERGLTNVRTVQGSAERLPFADASFDWVVSRYSAHHWRNVPAAMAELARVLKPGGQVCLIDVAGGPEPLADTHLQSIEVLRDPSHVRDYTEPEWLRFLATVSLPAEVSLRWRLPIEFGSWVTRMSTPPGRVAAIHEIWKGAPAEVREHYAAQADGSFEMDVIMLRARKAV
ncbi:class I SAM-dependent methyltransferase [Silvibacterium sp.]|uniref:class I SAM-dependent methyltransferase n=1 Tax=Silvibacterium sp. TaxID=1964179 RepID=UPI0039E38416